MTEPLYHHPELYGACFAPDAEEFASWRPYVSEHGITLDVGCGDGALARLFRAEGRSVMALDLAPRMLRAPWAVAGNLESLPLADASCQSIISAHYPYAYAHAVALLAGREFTGYAEAARVLGRGGLLTVEVPITEEPRKLQGYAESFRGDFGLYRFFLHDLLLENEHGAVLESEIRIEKDGAIYADSTPLFVYTAIGLASIKEITFNGVEGDSGSLARLVKFVRR